MNLEQSDSFKDEIEKNTRRRKSVMLSIVLCAILIAFLFILIMILKYQDSITEKLFLDDKQISIPKDLYRDIEGITYVNVKEMSSLLGYSYTKGEYNKFNEKEDSAYMENDFEVVAISSEKTKYEKYLQNLGNELTIAEIPVTIKSEPGYYEVFDLENPIKFVDGKLFVPLENIPEMFNTQISWEQYRKRIYTFESVIASSKKAISKLEYNQISGYYENLRALLYGYAIVGNGTAEESSSSKNSTAFGVMNLKDGKEIISVKYSDVKFIQNVQEFYVKVSMGNGDKTGNETMGILAADGSTIIPPSEFQEISVLDAENQLYLVRKGDEYGVVNRSGKPVVHPEFEEIGYDTTPFENDNIENQYLLFGRVIPVKGTIVVENDNENSNSSNKTSKGATKFGLYNLEGELVLPISYDSLGYKSINDKTSASKEKNVLQIPESVGIRGIVVCLDGLYGIFDVDKEELILPCTYTKIYSVTKSGVTTYYAEFNGEQLDLAKYLKDNNLVSVKEDSNEKSKDNNTTVEDNNTVVVENSDTEENVEPEENNTEE